MNVLRQSTASQSRILGPFVDDTDFTTLETGLSIANTDIQIMKNGSTGVNKNSGGGTHRANGMYSVTFDDTDTNTVGEFEVSCKMSGALIVVKSFTVMAAEAFDTLYADSPTILLDKDVGLVYKSTVGTVNSTTSFDFDDTINTDDAWNGNEGLIVDATNSDSAVVEISDVDQANDRVIIRTAPPNFTVAVGDTLYIFARKSVRYVLATEYGAATSTNVTDATTTINDRTVAMAQLLGRNDAAIKGDRSTELNLINNDEGSGAGDYDNETDSLEAKATTNIEQVNGVTLQGDGTSSNPWRPA